MHEMLATKAGVAVCGIITFAAGPFIAETTGVDILRNPWVQLGGMGIFGFLLWWLIAKTIPEISKQHRDGLGAISQEVHGLRDDIKTGMHEQNKMLRDVLVGARQNQEPDYRHRNDRRD